ncbi:MAG: DNA-binding response regulator [Acidobacteria bacterium 13_1_40CM_4_58_4]|nr:MAG: DNA-binding response regulator [Acidobacteria bacterium 13_1_40CM_4_58_4]
MDVTREQILVVDDEEDLRKAIVEILTLDGFEVDQVGSAEAAAEKLSQTHYDVLITDHNLPGKTGVELLEETLVRYPEIIGVVITGYGTIETAVSAIKKGAYNYLTKPFKLVELPIMVRKGLRERQLRFENQYLKKQLNEKYGFNNIIGSGRAMNRIFELVDTIAGLNSTVLIQGETGTGKELIAKAIHFNSPRKDQKLVSINCGAIPENLLESELFGHVKGAFTGAVQTRIGRFEQANGGTIFLDEIGNMPMALQVKLLRVLQEREFERVGGNSTVKVDVRIIAATSSNLDQMVKDGTFREDLFYRLNVIPINLPPLRERREDVPLLVQRFIEHFCERHKLDLKTISPQVTKALMAYEWPGNVRQLENIVERMVALTGNRPAILPTDLPSEIQNRESLNFVPLIEIPEEGINFQNVVTDMERELILQSLRKTNGNKKLAAKLLNLKRTTLIEKIKRIGLGEEIAASA